MISYTLQMGDGIPEPIRKILQQIVFKNNKLRYKLNYILFK